MKNYTTPKLKISKFNMEDVVTTSGEVSTQTLKERMEADGYTVTSVSLAEVNITL